MAMSMPKILDCLAVDCAYNQNKQCRTLAITVGASHPTCDTFLKTQKKGGSADLLGGVGACKVEDCRFNNMLECTASGIHVGMHEQHPDCTTFARK